MNVSGVRLPCSDQRAAVAMPSPVGAAQRIRHVSLLRRTKRAAGRHVLVASSKPRDRCGDRLLERTNRQTLGPMKLIYPCRN